MYSSKSINMHSFAPQVVCLPVQFLQIMCQSLTQASQSFQTNKKKSTTVSEFKKNNFFQVFFVGACSLFCLCACVSSSSLNQFLFISGTDAACIGEAKTLFV